MNSKALRILTVALFAIAISTSLSAQDAYTQKVKEYLDASGTLEAFKVVMPAMLKNFKEAYPQVPAEFWDEASKEFSDAAISDLVTMLAPVYKNHLTIEDLNEFIKFYHSPSGKKLAQNTTAISMESMQVGQDWGRKIGEKVVARLKEKGY